ncbi:Fc.00g106720.m01.CDS01 [Cosmosporella sp. VM-42]
MSDETSTATITQNAEATIPLRSAETDPQPPPPPDPSSDPVIAVVEDKAAAPKTSNQHDLFKLTPSEALKMLSASVERLVKMTGDIPPTPPPKSPTVPHMSGMQAEKENIARSHSERSLSRMRKQAELEAKKLASKELAESKQTLQSYCQPSTPQDIDGVHLKQSSTPTSPPAKPEPYIIVGADSQPLNLQHGAITRKFYSKNEPPITIGQYLLRLHQFCPMSTAVYLATSLYIYRLAVQERAIPVTRRNAHRLVLAGLRVAMKALEDLSYPHSKMAKVGGVSEAELARLEISFCFLAGFELVVGEKLLQEHCEILREGRVDLLLDGIEIPTLKLSRKPRGVPQRVG